MSLRGCVVSGGTGGLGRAVVATLVGRGVRVAVPYRSDAAWRELQAAHGTGALWGAPADIADASATRRFFDDAVAWLGGLDGVAALAGGYAGSGRMDAAPAGEWSRMLAVNLETAHNVCAAALPHLLARGGSVVTVGSRAVDTGGAGAAAYAVSKAGVVALTRALALENADRGVRFNCVVPATIDTPGNRGAMPTADISGWTPPEAIARIVAFLLSAESAPVTGALVPVQGRG